jgi:lipopolysaccharide export system protein LptA
MEGKGQKIIALALALLVCTGVSAQKKSEQKDSLVRLIKAKSLELMEKDGTNYRKTIDATFFHNNTYFICDTALWNVDTRIINAWGNVRVVQEGTILTSDKMDYLIDQDLIQARGTLVQLEDKEHNTLRTHYLDYNTKDSLAYFSKGASMKDKDGQIIESSDGSYDAKLGYFKFQNNVNMFTDSVFIRSSRINYESKVSRAIFPNRIDFWKEDNMLSADSGWYERLEETFFFNGAVHAMSKEQEAWCDTLYYYRTPNNVLMQGHVQVQDTTRNAFALSNELFYEDSIRQVTLRREAAVALRTEDKIIGEDGRQRTKIDTIYIGGDRLVYYTVRKCDIPEGVEASAKSRLEEIFSDPVSEYRAKAKKAAEEAARKAKEENAESNPLLAGRGGKGSGGKGSGGKSPGGKEEAVVEPPVIPREVQEPAEPEEPQEPLSPADSIAKAAMDSIARARADSIHIADSLAAIPPPDTSRVGFAMAVGGVKIYRKDIQVACDSMRFNELDSIARFYIDPIVWNDGNRQYTADSIGVLVTSAGIDRASLMSNAFIITQETPTLFDQIRATEVMAYFDTTAALRRFDALGGANAIFYLKEKEDYGTVNKVDSKMLSAYFQDGELQTILYFDAPKNDAYPLAQFKEEERKMKGFNWQPDLQPKGKEDITDLTVRISERKTYDARPKATFKQTDIYFPGYMKKVYAALAAAKNKPKNVVRNEEPPVIPNEVKESPDTPVIPSEAKEPSDSLSARDSVFVRDSLAIRDTLGVKDSLAVKDSLGVQNDSIAPPAPRVPSKYEIRRQQQKAKQAARDSVYQARMAARDARWAVADSIDAAKAAVKEQKKLEKKAAREEKARQKYLRQQEIDQRKLERYVERYRKKYERQKAKEAKAAEYTDKPIYDTDGKDPGQIPEVHSSGHPEQRGIGEPALLEKTVEPASSPDEGTE